MKPIPYGPQNQWFNDVPVYVLSMRLNSSVFVPSEESVAKQGMILWALLQFVLPQSILFVWPAV